MDKLLKAFRMEALSWGIQDAKDALQCAVSLGAWDGVIKYANQIKDMERELYSLANPVKGYLRPDGRYSQTG